ncbi:NUDIX domain-containing protein [Candidatus Pacearchaeota archaeon]|nr:NUDIX domain-containing protein [Candidatus Pacearchaeota archaeon]
MASPIYRAAVVLPLNSRQEMLLQLKDIGYPWNPEQWGFFGGKVEDGETPEITLPREMGEEMGKKKLLENISHFGDFPFMDVHVNGTRRSGFLHVYSADFVGNVSDIRLKEGKGFAFLSRQEMDRYNIVWHNRRVINAYYDSLLIKP